MTKVLTYVEIDIDYCSLTYGVAPCTASIPTTGAAKCFNTQNTCQDIANFANAGKTLRFGTDTSFLPSDIECIPSLVSVNYTPITVSLGEDLGIRANVVCTFKDHRHSDTGLDKYLADRSYNPFSQGSFWGKFRARVPYLRGRDLRLIRGTVGQALASMDTRHFIIESFTGPNTNGEYTIIAKDALKFADNDRAFAPRLNVGALSAGITNSATSLTLTPTGIGDEEYGTSGHVAIGGKEVVSYTRTLGSDTMTIVRARRNTVAVAHSANARVQNVLIYTSADPADIIYDLLVNYANVDASLIPLPSWQVETAAYLQRLYNTHIAEPVGVNTLISELVNQAALSIWWDESTQLLKLQVLRDLSQNADTISEEVYISRSLQIQEQPDKRVSQVWFYYDQFNPLKQLSDTENYQSVLVQVDLQSESFYGSPAIRKVFSRWIGTGGQTTAERAAEILIARYKDPPRRFSFSILRGTYDDLTIGTGYGITSWALQEADGSAETVPIQLISINPDAALTTAVAEEIRFAGIALDDPNLHEIVISSDTNNVNLRTVHDSLFSALTGTGVTIRCTISEGVKVGSSSTSTPAFEVGSWSFSPTIEVIVLGRIQGKGGNGGYIYPTSGFTGQDGGTALYTRYAIDLTVADGEIWGGGGGGAAYANQTGGGGGAGKVPGTGGAANPAFPTRSGLDGTTEAGGAGANVSGFAAGDGGGPGLAGSNSASGNVGGSAGSAIDGISYVTVIGGAGDRRGPEVN